MTMSLVVNAMSGHVLLDTLRNGAGVVVGGTVSGKEEQKWQIQEIVGRETQVQQGLR